MSADSEADSKQCARCGKTFPRKPREGHARFQTRSFCSRACQYNDRRNKPFMSFMRPLPVETIEKLRSQSELNEE